MSTSSIILRLLVAIVFGLNGVAATWGLFTGGVGIVEFALVVLGVGIAVLAVRSLVRHFRNPNATP